MLGVHHQQRRLGVLVEKARVGFRQTEQVVLGDAALVLEAAPAHALVQGGGRRMQVDQDYSTSKWSRKESALTADEAAAIEANGLYNLSEFLPKKPSDVELKVIKEMFEASVDGQAYDTERWGAYYRPRGVSAPAGGSAPAAASVAQAAPAPVAAPAAPVAEDEDIP